jgi:hypothetical protein
MESIKQNQATTNQLDFLSSLFEARMTRDSRDQKVLTYTDCAERLYLTLLILQLLNQYPTYRQLATRYARETKHSNYDRFRMYSTDLYNFVYFVTGDEEAINKLKDPKNAMEMRKKSSFPTMAFNRYLSALQQGLIAPSIMQIFLSIENGLRLRNADYKSIRRSLFQFNTLSARDKQNLVTRLLHAARAKLRSSDSIEHLEKLAADRNLETGRVNDAEPKVSVPDVSTQGRDLALYRYLVGGKNLVAVKRFIDSALSGKSIPSSIVGAYLPAIKLIDDIVKAGPAFVSVLKALQSRAKKTRK